MVQQMVNVLIVEDDFRVANINKQFINKVDGFNVIGITSTGEETLEFLKSNAELPDLLLLDVYIPDVTGLDLLWNIRRLYRSMDIIMVTAAKEVETIEEALRGGITDYIIKPVDFERLRLTLERYRESRMLLRTKQEISQSEVDRIRGGVSTTHSTLEYGELPKGIDRLTLDKVITILKKNNEQGFTAVEMSKHIGASRSTARRYLEYLVSTGQVKAELIYGDVGRPERRYVFA
ncbi:response regulator [Anaerobacillus sp. MEB173]|uniref:response regulator n=1 Tax=Anaerobacillus sp. MEB173 TaxID=3383345 RepID=UPI003F905B57